jgi:signal transduction histidine kinase
LESGRLTLELVPVDLETLVEKTVSAASNWSGSHSMLLHSVAPMQVRVDPLRFEEVLINLLDNAIKYSPEGGSIEIDLSPCGVNAAEISVRDWGIGIPLERRSMIFERFYQAHEELHRPGMGLGLYVSRQIVELHGGDIRAEFPDDGGTRFVVLLPTTNLAP